MLQVLLIDDEISTLKLLPKVIDWEELGLAICGSASDGEEGLELFRSLKPDIVIVDIKMPRMDGLAFSRAVRESGRNVKIILLSAYAEFQFAQAAMQLKINDYLLKPLDEQKLREALSRAIHEIEEERKRPAAAEPNSFYSEMSENPALPPAEAQELSSIALESSIQTLTEQANPAPLLEHLSSLLGQMFDRRMDPAQIFEFLIELQSQTRIAITHCYGHQTAKVVRSVSLEELRECMNPETLLSRISEWVGQVAVRLSTILSENPNHAIVRKAKSYVDQYYSNTHLSLQSVADYTGISKNYFSTVFHDVTGICFWDYVTRVRIDQAKRLLTGTTLSNYEISQKIGYESEYHFCRKFKELAGLSPHQYRTGMPR